MSDSSFVHSGHFTSTGIPSGALVRRLFTLAGSRKRAAYAPHDADVKPTDAETAEAAAIWEARYEEYLNACAMQSAFAELRGDSPQEQTS